MMLTLDEISQKYHISKRKLESNLARLKPIYEHTSKMTYTGQKWLIDSSLIKEITNRKYAKHYVEFDSFKKVDEVTLKDLIKEKELCTFLTIAPRQITSLIKVKDIVRDVFDYYQTNYTAEHVPTFFIYGIETNTNYHKDKPYASEKDYDINYHIHAVTNAKYNAVQKQEITQILQEQIDDYRIHDIHTVAISPYLQDIGMGGLAYSLKLSGYTGTYIK